MQVPGRSCSPAVPGFGEPGCARASRVSSSPGGCAEWAGAAGWPGGGALLADAAGCQGAGDAGKMEGSRPAGRARAPGPVQPPGTCNTESLFTPHQALVQEARPAHALTALLVRGTGHCRPARRCGGRGWCASRVPATPLLGAVLFSSMLDRCRATDTGVKMMAAKKNSTWFCVRGTRSPGRSGSSPAYPARSRWPRRGLGTGGDGADVSRAGAWVTGRRAQTGVHNSPTKGGSRSLRERT